VSSFQRLLDRPTGSSRYLSGLLVYRICTVSVSFLRNAVLTDDTLTYQFERKKLILGDLLLFASEGKENTKNEYRLL